MPMAEIGFLKRIFNEWFVKGRDSGENFEFSVRYQVLMDFKGGLLLKIGLA